MARTDDIINVAGHRLSTGAMEEVLAAHPDVAECAVIGVADAAQGPAARRLPRPEGGRRAAARRDRRRGRAAGARAHRRRSRRSRPRLVVDRLPKTRSGKILRGDDARGSPTASRTRSRRRSTIPPILDEIGEALRRSGTRAREPTSNRMPSGYHENVPEEREAYEQVVISSAAPTAIGDFGHSLRDVPPTELGVNAARAAIERANIESPTRSSRWSLTTSFTRPPRTCTWRGRRNAGRAPRRSSWGPWPGRSRVEMTGRRSPR